MLGHRYASSLLIASRPRLLTPRLWSGPLRDHVHETHRDVCISLDALEAPGGEMIIPTSGYTGLNPLSCRHTIFGCGSPSLSLEPCTGSSFYRLFSAWRAGQGSRCRRPTKSGCRPRSGVGTSIRELDPISSLSALTDALSVLSSPTISRSSATETHTIISFNLRFLLYFPPDRIGRFPRHKALHQKRVVMFPVWEG